MLQRVKPRSFILLLAVGAAVGVFRCTQNTAVDYPVLSCERHNIMHDRQVIIGVEDMAYDAQQNHIYISAYDRRHHADGGLYRLSPHDMGNIEKLKTPTPVQYPHGISLTRDGKTVSLNVIDRDLSDPKKISASLRHFTWGDGTPEIIEDTTLPKTADSLCNANDVVVSDGQYFITSDHQSCRYSGRKRENVFQANSAHLLSFDLAKDAAIETIIPKLYFANGIALSQDHIYIAETRKKRLSIYDQTTERLKHRIDIALAGGPDNLTVTEDGDLWAALHPSLMTFATYRAGWRQNAPSRVSRIKTNRQDGSNIKTYDIPSHIISGATVALQVDNTLFLGAAFDTAIASCELAEESK